MLLTGNSNRGASTKILMNSQVADGVNVTGVILVTCKCYIDTVIYGWKQRMEERPSKRRSDARTGIDTARQRQPSESALNESYMK